MAKDTDYKKLWRKGHEVNLQQLQIIEFFKGKLELSIKFCREKLSPSDFEDFLKLLGLQMKEEKPEEKPKTTLILPKEKPIIH